MAYRGSIRGRCRESRHGQKLHGPHVRCGERMVRLHPRSSVVNHCPPTSAAAMMWQSRVSWVGSGVPTAAHLIGCDVSVPSFLCSSRGVHVSRGSRPHIKRRFLTRENTTHPSSPLIFNFPKRFSPLPLDSPVLLIHLVFPLYILCNHKFAPLVFFQCSRGSTPNA